MRLAPAGYRCPFCRLVAGEDLSADYSKQSDVVWRDDEVTGFVSSAWWPANSGHVLVVPNAHHESVYDLPDDVLARVQVVGKRVALAIRRSYGSEGTSFRQHNEPAGNQEVWHYHLHVFPRYAGDMLYERTWERRDTTPRERLPYAERLRAYFRDEGVG
jgi:histidine triad (HIT) family protein